MNRQPNGTRNTRRCRPDRLFALCLLAGLSLFGVTPGSRDALFDKYPVARWVTENPPSTRFKWRLEVPNVELSSHQRLMARLIVRVDGRELEKRRGDGEFLTLFQFEDSAGRVWQNHVSLDLLKLQPVQNSEVTMIGFAFVLPGDYTLTIAAVDTKNGEHSTIVRKLHVDNLKSEPLPGSWAGLPPVEFITSVSDPPDVWYLPEIQTHLVLNLQTQRPLHVQILVNTTPSERSSGSAMAMRRNMSVVIPALKVLSQIHLTNGTLDAAFLDLTHRKIPFEQKNIHGADGGTDGETDWARARQFFLGINPGIVDVQTLQGQWKMRKFFWDEASRRLEPKDAALPVEIIVSGPAFFEDQQAVDPLPEPPGDKRIFYIRYRTIAPPPRVRPRPGMRPPMPPRSYAQMPVDDLQHTVEPLGARTFDVTNPEQFRRVLAAVLEQLSKL